MPTLSSLTLALVAWSRERRMKAISYHVRVSDGAALPVSDQSPAPVQLYALDRASGLARAIYADELGGGGGGSGGAVTVKTLTVTGLRTAEADVVLPTTLALYINGLRQPDGYTVSGQTVTFSFDLPAVSNIEVRY